MIICKLAGGFGNHLLCVSLGIILANKWNTKIKIIGNGEGINDFSKDTRNTIFKIINKDILIEDNKKISRRKRVIIINKENYYNIFNNFNINHDYIISCIHIDDMNIYRQNIHIINTYLIINKFFDYDYDNTITVSIRLGREGEGVYPSPFQDEEAYRLPFEYYKDGINEIMKKKDNITTILICCDNFDDKFIKQFEIFENNITTVIYNKKNTYYQFCDIINSKYFISSLSTFSLWGVLLNTNNRYVPFYKNSSNIVKYDKDEFYKNSAITLYNMESVSKIFI